MNTSVRNKYIRLNLIFDTVLPIQIRKVDSLVILQYRLYLYISAVFCVLSGTVNKFLNILLCYKLTGSKQTLYGILIINVDKERQDLRYVFLYISFCFGLFILKE